MSAPHRVAEMERPRALDHDPEPDQGVLAFVRPSHCRRSWRRDACFPSLIVSVFIGGLVIGWLMANALGRLPTAEQLEAEDRARFRKLEREA